LENAIIKYCCILLHQENKGSCIVDVDASTATEFAVGEIYDTSLNCTNEATVIYFYGTIYSMYHCKDGV
jgi:hypothetical protein